MQAVVHDGGVGQDPPRRQKQLPFKSAPATWLEATRASGCDAESEWKALPSEELRAIKAVADAAAKDQDNVANHKPRLPSAQPSRRRKQWQRASQRSLHALAVIELLVPSARSSPDGSLACSPVAYVPPNVRMLPLRKH
jgi:hypothetical protein